MHETRVDQKIFSKFPDFRRGIVIARNMNNHGSSKQLETLLDEALRKAADNPVDLKTDPRTAVWNETYRELGCNPNKFPPAHLSLLKRIQKPGVHLPFINKAVAIMNDNSIRGMLPVGGDDVHRAGNVLELRFSDGNERFTPLSDPEKIERPAVEEVIYVVAETKEVMCRRWNWRNGFQTRITEDTTSLVMNIDGLGQDAQTRAIQVRDRVAEMLKYHCEAEVETALLTPATPAYAFQL